LPLHPGCFARWLLPRVSCLHTSHPVAYGHSAAARNVVLHACLPRRFVVLYACLPRRFVLLCACLARRFVVLCACLARRCVVLCACRERCAACLPCTLLRGATCLLCTPLNGAACLSCTLLRSAACLPCTLLRGDACLACTPLRCAACLPLQPWLTSCSTAAPHHPTHTAAPWHKFACSLTARVPWLAFWTPQHGPNLHHGVCTIQRHVLAETRPWVICWPNFRNIAPPVSCH
jgi:hypothetical protein